MGLTRTIIFKADEEMQQQIKALAQIKNISRGRLIRDALNQTLTSYEEAINEHAKHSRRIKGIEPVGVLER